MSTHISNETKVMRAEAAQVTLRRGNASGHGAGDDWAAAPCALRFGKCLRKLTYARAAERNAIARVQHPGANPARRGKQQRGERLTHAAPRGTRRSRKPLHNTPGLLLLRDYLTR